MWLKLSRGEEAFALLRRQLPPIIAPLLNETHGLSWCRSVSSPVNPFLQQSLANHQSASIYHTMIVLIYYSRAVVTYKILSIVIGCE